MKSKYYYYLIILLVASLSCKALSFPRNETTTPSTNSNQSDNPALPSENLATQTSVNNDLDFTPVAQWTTFIGTEGNIIITMKSDKDGNLYFLEKSKEFSEKNLTLKKMDKNGELSLMATFLDVIDNHANISLAFDNEGNIYFSGASAKAWGNPITPFDPSNPLGHNYPLNIFVAKIDRQGNVIWNTFINDYESVSLEVDDLNNVYLAVFDGTTPKGNFSIIKLNNNGALQWKKEHTLYPDELHLDTNGNIYILGSRGEDECFITKLNNNGDLIWNSIYGKPDQHCGDASVMGDNLVVDKNGNVYIAGESNSNWENPLTPFHGGYDGNPDGFADYIVKFDSDGNLQWNTYFENNYSTIYGLMLDTNQNLVIAGEDSGDGYLTQINPNGQILKSIYFGGEGYDEIHFLSQVNDEFVFIGGRTNESFGNPLKPFSGNYDMFVILLKY